MVIFNSSDRTKECDYDILLRRVLRTVLLLLLLFILFRLHLILRIVLLRLLLLLRSLRLLLLNCLSRQQEQQFSVYGLGLYGFRLLGLPMCRGLVSCEYN